MLSHLNVHLLGKIEYLGLCPTKKKIKAIKHFPRPTTGKKFLGLANLYRRHIRSMGMISKPLTALTIHTDGFSRAR